MDGRPHRVLRGSALAGLSALLTACGHVAGGGTVPDLAVLTALLPLLAGLMIGIAERCRGPVTTVATLAAGQVWLHALMTVLHHHPHAADAAPGPVMLGGHAVATVLTAALLRHADAVLTALARALRGALPRPVPAPPVAAPPPAHAVPDLAVPARTARLLLAAHALRGPPVVRV